MALGLVKKNHLKSLHAIPFIQQNDKTVEIKNRKGAGRWVTLQRDNMREFFDDNGKVLHLYCGSSYMR